MGADQIAAICPALVEVSEGAQEGENWCATFSEWQPGRLATFHIVEGLAARPLARLVDLLFVTVLGCGADYPVDVELTLLRGPG